MCLTAIKTEEEEGGEKPQSHAVVRSARVLPTHKLPNETEGRSFTLYGPLEQRYLVLDEPLRPLPAADYRGRPGHLLAADSYHLVAKWAGVPEPGQRTGRTSCPPTPSGRPVGTVHWDPPRSVPHLIATSPGVVTLRNPSPACCGGGPWSGG